VQGVVDEDADGPPSGGGDAADHLLGLVIEGLGEEAVDGAGIGAALGLLVLELVHLTEHLDRNEDMVVLEPVQAVRVVKENIRVDNEVLHRASRTFPFRFRGCWNEDALFGGFQRGGSVHGACFYDDGLD
jgi:hypothetical protein